MIAKALAKTQKDLDHAGDILMNWPNLKVLELQTAKEILAEIFRARPEDIEDMQWHRKIGF